jgi:hypothetical protein
MGRVLPPLVRERCQICSREMTYMPLGKMCLYHGYAINRWWIARRLTRLGIALPPPRGEDE